MHTQKIVSYIDVFCNISNLPAPFHNGEHPCSRDTVPTLPHSCDCVFSIASWPPSPFTPQRLIHVSSPATPGSDFLVWLSNSAPFWFQMTRVWLLPRLPIPTSNTAAFLFCSRTPCTRKYSPFTNYLRLWPSSLTLCFPGLVYTISLSGWPVDQSTLPLTNCSSLHLILQVFFF